MNPKLRFKSLAIASAAASLILLLTGLLILRSDWFADYLRMVCVRAIDNVTGGHATLGRFSFDWRTLTANLNALKVQGTEPRDGPPLFYAKQVRVRFKVLGLLTRGVRLSDLYLKEPAAYILQQPGGGTNIPKLLQGPSRPGGSAEELFRLKISRAEVDNGFVQVNSRRVPLLFNGRDLNLVLRYRSRPAAYRLTLTLADIYSIVPGQEPIRASLTLDGALTSKDLKISKFDCQSGRSKISLNGIIRYLENPSADLVVKSIFQGTDVARWFELPWLKSGEVSVYGKLHHDVSVPIHFAGDAVGTGLSYHRHGVDLDNVSFHSALSVTPQVIDLPHLRMAALDGAVSGDLTFTRSGNLGFHGDVSAIDMRRFLAMVLSSPPPYSAAVTGKVTMEARLTNTVEDATINAAVALSPAKSGQPVSGNVLVSYRQREKMVSFGSSELFYPKTHISFSGTLDSALRLSATTSSVADLKPTLDWLGLRAPPALALDLAQSQAGFDGDLTGPIANPRVSGSLSLRAFSINGVPWNSASSQFTASDTGIDVRSLSLDNQSTHLHGSGSLSLIDWSLSENSSMDLRAVLRSSDVGATIRPFAGGSGSVSGGVGSASLMLSGRMDRPNGWGGFTARDLNLYGEHLNQFHAAASISGLEAHVGSAFLQSGSATASISAHYSHVINDWSTGTLHVGIDSNRFPLDSVAAIRRRIRGLTARSEIHGTADFAVNRGVVDPLAANGTLALRSVTVNELRRGDLTLDAATQGDLLTVGLAGNLESSPVSGNLRAHLSGYDPAEGDLRFGNLSLVTIMALANPLRVSEASPIRGSMEGRIAFSGPLLRPENIDTHLILDSLELRSADPALSTSLPAEELILRNLGPVKIDFSGSKAVVRNFKAAGRDTQAELTGSVDLRRGTLNLLAMGSIDFRAFQLIDPDLQSAGTAKISIAVAGTTDRPLLDGTMELRNGSLFLPNLTNGLSDLSGTVRFTRDQAFVQNLTGQTGGGTVRLGGVVSFASRGPLIYNLEANANHVRVRYLRASVSGDAVLRMTGTSQNGLLTGSVSISRIVLEPGTDLSTLLASAAGPTATPVNDPDFITGITLDVHIQSTPDMQVLTSLSQDVQADIDLRLRGTRDRPVLLGRITANQGELTVFGTRYTINRGNITFVNAVQIEPVLDLDLQTETRGITVDIVISGTLSKLTMNYRSDPPLQAKEIIALLTVGQAPSFASATSNDPSRTDVTALQAGANTVLGQAISPASNRLSKLFGITNIRIDPFVQNITNTPQARLTLEQQISRDITVTYITNLAQTSEQIFRFEWAFNRQYSLVAVRDDNGEFGLDIQYKRRFK